MSKSDVIRPAGQGGLQPTSKREKRVRCKILAVASAGGHWIELLRLREAFEGVDMVYATTQASYEPMVGGARFRTLVNATRDLKLQMVLLIFQMIWILLRERPTAIVTTGAAPGYVAIRLGKWFGAKTLWIDSMANAGELSMSGQLAMRHADVVLTQWSHLAVDGVIDYKGAVI